MFAAGLSVVLAAPAPAHAACPNIVVVAARGAGDADLVAALRAELAARGMSDAPAAGCSVVNATVGHAGAGVDVIISDSEGRTSERLLTDVVSAAVLIESWTHPELYDAMLGPPQSAVVPPPSESLTFALTAALESSVGSDGSVWGGAALTGAAGWGHARAGLTLRFSNDLEFFGDAARLDADRADVEILGTADFPVRAGRFVISPGLAIGAGWMRARSPDPDMDHIVVDDDHIGLRVDAHAATYLPLTDGFQLYVSVAVALVPLAHGTSNVVGQPFVIGEPQLFVRVGAGLSFGARQ